MTDPQAAQLGAVVAGLAVLAFYGTLLIFLVLGACHLWLDLRERLEERRAKRKPPRRGPSGPPPLKLRRSGDPAKPQFPPPQVIREDRWP